MKITVANKRGMSSSALYDFFWLNAAPSSFSITSVANEVPTLNPLISWEAASDINPVTYTVTIYESDCSTLHQQKSGLTTLAYNLEKGLTDNQSYCISVIAIDSLIASTKATNDKFPFTVKLSNPVTLSGTFAWANEAADGYIKFGEQNLSSPVAVFVGEYGSIDFTSLLDDSTPQVCDANQDYDLSAIPNIDSLLADGAYSLCARLQDASGNTMFAKSPTTLYRDVLFPSVTADVTLDTVGVLSDGKISALEYASASNMVSSGIVAVGADLIGYAFVPSGDTCNTVTSYKDPLLSSDEGISSGGAIRSARSFKTQQEILSLTK